VFGAETETTYHGKGETNKGMHPSGLKMT
jgi:hypothetical protein